MANTQPLVSRRFSSYSQNPLDTVTWSRRTCEISDTDGSAVFRAENLEFPTGWSQLACNIAASKYFRKAGIRGDSSKGEESLKSVIERIVSAIRSAGQDLDGYFDLSKNENFAFSDDLAYLLVNQIGAFNSPVWFNCGLWHSYGIEGQGGSLAWDQKTDEIVETTNTYERPQCSACFIQSVDDDLMSIYDLLKNEARLFKYGSGTGTNFSAIRGKQERLSGGGTSSGLMSFLEVFDRAAGATKSGGTTRRAAKMVCLDMDHPEILPFIEWKMNEENKVRALIGGGYPADFNGEAYRTVSGQNSNNSVRVTDEFMYAVEGRETWYTALRTTGEHGPVYQAHDLWMALAKAAWACADPGIQYHDTINAWHTCPNFAPITASNPCSEFMFLDDSACNLASLNLTKFLDSEGKFDIEGFKHAVRIFVIAQDIIVDLSSYPTKEIARNSHDYRPIGLGYANLGAMLMSLGIPYDSDEGRAICSAITSLMTATAYQVSAEIASKKGPFKRFAMNKTRMLGVIERQAKLAADIPSAGLESWDAVTKASLDAWAEAISLGNVHGFRNAQVTVLAPTGTIGLLMDCDTTGIEPDFALVKYKKLAGGGSVKIVNQAVSKALIELGYPYDERQAIVEHMLETGSIEDSRLLRPRHASIFDTANRNGKTGKRLLPPMAHLRMMTAAQPFLSGAISKTINLPNEATVQDVADIYMEGWKLGLKAVAIYRDGCKLSQPLSSVGATKESLVQAKATVEPAKMPSAPSKAYGERDRLPKKRRGFTQEARVGGHKIFLRTGEYDDGRLGEIFIDMHKEGSAFRSMINCFAMAVSVGLQHGVPLETYVDQFTFTRFEPQGLVEDHPNIKMATSIVDYIFRAIGLEYLDRQDLCQVKTASEVNGHAKPEAVPSDCSTGDAPMCDACGHVTVRNGTCYRCLNCGSSMGCS